MKDFRFRGLDDPDVYYDSVARRLVDAYRLWFSEAALQLSDQGRPELARPLVQRLSERVPFDVLASDFQTRLRMAEAHAATGDTARALTLLRQTGEGARGGRLLAVAQSYARLGQTQEALRLAEQAEMAVLERLRRAGTNRASQQAVRQVQTLRYLYLDAGAYDKAAAFSAALAEATGTPSLRQSADELRRSFEAPAPTDSAAVPVAPTRSPAGGGGNGAR
jgi:tetratricopeptide (TPR) repeat protein